MTTAAGSQHVGGYPQRSSYFAHKFVRLLTKAAVAQDIGPEACWLLTVIAHQEDAKRYAGPVTFWNDQLMPLCGFGGRDRLVRARNRAVEHGWLHYEQGRKANIGKYWVQVPHGYDKVQDGPVDESSDAFLHPETGLKPGADTDLPSQNRTETRLQSDGNRTANPPHSSLSLNPIPDSSCPDQGPDESNGNPKTKRKQPTNTPEDLATATWMWDRIRDMQPDRKEPDLAKWADTIRLMRERDQRTHDGVRQLFTQVQADRFWRVNVLCPDTLRAKWDDLTLKLVLKPQGKDSGKPKGGESLYKELKPPTGGGNDEPTR